jgi:hypothetical protein
MMTNKRGWSSFAGSATQFPAAGWISLDFSVQGKEEGDKQNI